MPSQSLSRRLTAEGLGTGLLLAAIVGSGIMGEQLSGGNSALALFCNSTATGAMLIGTVLDELERRDQTTGLVTMCIGGGMGITTIIERL